MVDVGDEATKKRHHQYGVFNIFNMNGGWDRYLESLYIYILYYHILSRIYIFYIYISYHLYRLILPITQTLFGM